MVTPTALEQLKSAYRAWNSGKASSAQPFFDLMAEDVNWRSIAGGAQAMEFSRPHLNKDQVKAYFAELAVDWEMVFYHVRAYLVSGDKVAVVCECAWRHKKTGKTVHTPKLDIVRFDGDKMVEFFEYFDNAQAIAACSGKADPGSPPPSPLFPGNEAQVIEGETENSRQNVAALEHLYREWNRTKGRSVQTIMDILAPNVSWGSLANGAEGVAFAKRGLVKEQIPDYFTGLSENFEMGFYRADEFLTAGDFVLMIGSCSFTNRRTGKSFTTPKADLWRFSGDKAVEFFEFYDTAAALASTQQPGV